MPEHLCSRRRFLGLAGGLAALAGVNLAACGGRPVSAGSGATSALAGEVTYDGASSFQILVELAAEQFMDQNPGVIITGSGNGSGKGLTAVAEGTVSIGTSDIPAESRLGTGAAASLRGFEVAVAGIGPIVSKNVDVDNLTLEQLRGIFSGAITNWREVGGHDAKIVVYNRKAGSGTRISFEDAVFGGAVSAFKGDAELDKSGDVQTNIQNTDNAISYLDFSHFNAKGFRAVKVDGAAPTSEHVADGSFPIWMVERMYCRADADEATRAFLAHMLTDEVQDALLDEFGLISIADMDAAKGAVGAVRGE